jgi:hypothetical protein
VSIPVSSIILSGQKEKGEPKKTVTVREIRRKSASGHKTAIITANYMLTILKIALLMFARWRQENFFKYIVESFGIDSITSYLKNKLPDTSMIVNPEYKALEQEHKKIIELLSHNRVKYAETILIEDNDLSEKEQTKLIEKKAEFKQNIEIFEKKEAVIQFFNGFKP